MGFNNSAFLFGFLPLLLLAYRFTPTVYRNGLLLAGSLVFFAWGEPIFVFILLATTLVDFFLVKWMDRLEGPWRQRMMVISMTINGLLLLLFKYTPPVLQALLPGQTFEGAFPEALMAISVPIGISFFTFESVTYVVDVYRKEQRPAPTLGDYFLYIFFFPKLVAGPIIRYRDFSWQLNAAGRTVDPASSLPGFYRLFLGFGKKILIADQLRLYIVNPTFQTDDYTQLHPLTAWVAILAATIMIYADFSGYSDMAVGLSRLFGFSIPENFRHPFVARSIREFWTRWHISLGKWLQSYVYFPLGGSRKSRHQTVLNLMLVFAICGIWHGANLNYLLWGLLYGVLVVIEHLADRQVRALPRAIGVLYVFLAVMGANIVFMTEDPGHCLAFLGAMVHFNTTAPWSFHAELWMFLGAGMIYVMYPLLPDSFVRKLDIRDAMSVPAHLAWTATSVIIFILGLVWMTASSYQSFLYFRF